MDFWFTKEHKLYATKINELLHDSILQQEFGAAAREK
jgi:hypothetical protein